MADRDLPPEVQRLIADVVASMDHVEVLRRIYASGETLLSVDDLAADAHIERGLLGRVLHDLQHARLISGANDKYRYTGNAQETNAVRQLIEMYNTRPVTLVRAVYARISPVKTFADAFRLRRED
jgi:DNA-binding transcriptional regulator YhcF (GntR family)